MVEVIKVMVEVIKVIKVLMMFLYLWLVDYPTIGTIGAPPDPAGYPVFFQDPAGYGCRIRMPDSGRILKYEDTFEDPAKSGSGRIQTVWIWSTGFITM